MPTFEHTLQTLQPDLIAFAQQLVRIRSYSGEEEEIIRFIAAKMHALGFSHIQIDTFGNLVGQIGSGETALLFDAHVDTVQVTDESEWRVPPFSGAILDGNLYGRGSVDMKSGAAAAIYAAAAANQLGLLSGKRVYVSCTVFEEDCDGENLKTLLPELHLQPHYAIICEPSGNLITLGHKGKAQILITTHGVSAHGSAPEKGVNAVYAMAEIIQRVEQTNAKLAAHPAPRPTLVLSRISSTAASLNAVPAQCEIYLDRRLIPGETEADIHAEMDALIAGKPADWRVGTLHRTTWSGKEIHYDPFHLAWRLDLDHPLARAAIAAYTQTFASPPPAFDFWDFSTNAVTTVSRGIPTIGFGPGEYKQAHMRDEHCPLTQISDACAFYTHLIQTI